MVQAYQGAQVYTHQILQSLDGHTLVRLVPAASAPPAWPGTAREQMAIGSRHR